MIEYQKLMRHVLETGVYKMDRTGTGAISVFGTQNRYSLIDGFPLVTTKKVHLQSIIHELLWFIKGDTNVKYRIAHAPAHEKLRFKERRSGGLHGASCSFSSYLGASCP